MREPVELIEASEEDTRLSVRRAVERSGFTPAELAEQAATHNFPTVSARIAWMALSDYATYL